ncbi:hypothetical protein DSLASN_34640 [Desulfoluna limicola]|uniref:DUF523 domain-containing protein n=1 Tax=Desulfoluna limicola TaxID=2810562 RepID=A0ABM7PJV1_9BACT|nr:DUF523 domain-containing protein [Desulfoluna limicola]BCS97832.1 hypothetical protein DSLASN_34640 [Desulfoluna limicola]
MSRLMISACLAGEAVRYDGEPLEFVDPRVLNWLRDGRAFLFCPEVEGGLPTPRDPAEIKGTGSGEAVLKGTATVTTENGGSVTDAFVTGAQKALALCLAKGVRFALLKERSPSCGSHQVYNGHFSGTRIPGQGVTAALLAQHGIHVFSEEELDALAALMI